MKNVDIGSEISIDALSGILATSVDCCIARFGRSGSGALAGQVRFLSAELSRILRPAGSTWFFAGDNRSASGLAGLPWRIASELQNDGWTVRNAVIVATEAGDYETALFCVKQARYYFDLAAVRSELGPGRGDVVLTGVAGLVERIVLAACPSGGVVLDLTDGHEVRAAADCRGRAVVRPETRAVA